MDERICGLVAPARLQLARLPTPLEPLDRLSQAIGGPRIWVKRDDLSECAASGNKIRKLEFTIAQALADGADTLLTCGGLQSNHCRATALLGARLGLGVELVLRGEPQGIPDGNLFLDRLAGAAVHTYPVQRYQQELDELLATHAARAARRGSSSVPDPDRSQRRDRRMGLCGRCRRTRSRLRAGWHRAAAGGVRHGFGRHPGRAYCRAGAGRDAGGSLGHGGL
jgi:1-aminocyclopropane-1-carboxylate deaminase/D-cysteine desulfhydrase-like pyridoxal-dependent ACC family enzyme